MSETTMENCNLRTCIPIPWIYAESLTVNRVVGQRNKYRGERKKREVRNEWGRLGEKKGG